MISCNCETNLVTCYSSVRLRRIHRMLILTHGLHAVETQSVMTIVAERCLMGNVRVQDVAVAGDCPHLRNLRVLEWILRRLRERTMPRNTSYPSLMATPSAAAAQTV